MFIWIKSSRAFSYNQFFQNWGYNILVQFKKDIHSLEAKVTSAFSHLTKSKDKIPKWVGKEHIL